jgi:phospholipid/cholesterol/gamma-HCH transport system substrate-binding protein
LRGIDVGTVTDIEIVSDTTVKVEMIIENKVRRFIKKDSKAVIASEGLMGNKIISIDAGSPGAKMVSDNDMIQTTKPLDPEDILKNLKSTTDNATEITTGLARIVKRIDAGEGTIGTLLTDNSLATDLKQTMSNMNKISGTLQSQVGSITSDVSGVTAKIKNGDGALGVLLSDTSFSNSLKKSMAHVQSASKSLDENMEALKHSFLLRRYYSKNRKNEKELENEMQDEEDSSGSDSH